MSSALREEGLETSHRWRAQPLLRDPAFEILRRMRAAARAKAGMADTEVPHHNVSEHKSTVFEMSHAERAALIEGNRADAELVSFCEGQLPLWYN